VGLETTGGRKKATPGNSRLNPSWPVVPYAKDRMMAVFPGGAVKIEMLNKLFD
jgi:hypothetical protein